MPNTHQSGISKKIPIRTGIEDVFSTMDDAAMQRV
jgi:hypothetical protein